MDREPPRRRAPCHRTIVPSFRSGPRHRAGARRHHRCDRRRSRHRPSHQTHDRLLALAAPPRLGAGRNRAAGDRWPVRRLGGRRRHDDAQGPAGDPLPQSFGLDQPRRETPGSTGLARAVDLQPSVCGRRSLRVGAPDGFPAGARSSGAPPRRRNQSPGALGGEPGAARRVRLRHRRAHGGARPVRAPPRESVIYFGDTARVPYGPKSPDTVRRYAAEILAYLLQRGVKALVVACNTITAQALDYLQERSPVPLVGVIEPGARAAVQATRAGTIGVIGTAGTIASGAYERAITAIRPDSRVHAWACPLFVPFVE